MASAIANPAKGTNKKKPCLKDCGEDYKPVCGGDGSGKGNKSFGSKCVLENYNCEKGLSKYTTLKNLEKIVNNCVIFIFTYFIAWTVQSPGECPGGGGVRLQ